MLKWPYSYRNKEVNDRRGIESNRWLDSSFLFLVFFHLFCVEMMTSLRVATKSKLFRRSEPLSSLVQTASKYFPPFHSTTLCLLFSFPYSFFFLIVFSFFTSPPYRKWTSTRRPRLLPRLRGSGTGARSRRAGTEGTTGTETETRTGTGIEDGTTTRDGMAAETMMSGLRDGGMVTAKR